MVKLMKKIEIRGYANFTSTLRVEEGAFGCPCLVGEQNWDHTVEADIYIGSKKALAKMWQVLKVFSDYYMPYDVPNFNNDTEYCIVVEFENEFGKQVPVPRILRKDCVAWEYYLGVTPYKVAYGDIVLADNLYESKFEEWKKNNTWF